MFNRIVSAVVVGSAIAVGANIASNAKQNIITESRRETVVLLTRQYLNNSNEIVSDFVDYNGILYVSEWNGKCYDTYAREFDGTGSVFTEPYEVADDGFVGDLFDAVVWDNGTPNDSTDDTLFVLDYVGCVLPD